MPFPLLAAIPAIAAGVGAIGNAISGRQQVKANRESIAANRQLAEYSYSKDLEMWNRNNDYNSPQNQMSRLSQAGLNPNLVYGSGSASGNSSQQMPKYNAPTVEYATQPTVDLPALINTYQDFKMRQAQTDNVKAQTANIESRTVNESLRGSLLDVQGRTGEQDLQQKQYIAPYQAGIVGNQARASEAKLQQEWEKLQLMKEDVVQRKLNQDTSRKNLRAIDLENEKREADILFKKFQNQWMKDGVTSSDHPLLRILVRMMGSEGLTMKDAIHKAADFKKAKGLTTLH